MSDTVHILPCVGNGRTDSVKSNKTHVVRIDFMTGCLSFATADNFWLSSAPADGFWLSSKGGGVNWSSFVMHRRFWRLSRFHWPTFYKFHSLFLYQSSKVINWRLIILIVSGLESGFILKSVLRYRYIVHFSPYTKHVNKFWS